MVQPLPKSFQDGSLAILHNSGVISHLFQAPIFRTSYCSVVTSSACFQLVAPHNLHFSPFPSISHSHSFFGILDRCVQDAATTDGIVPNLSTRIHWIRCRKDRICAVDILNPNPSRPQNTSCWVIIFPSIRKTPWRLSILHSS